MGLDMYVYRVHEPHLDENKVYDRDNVDGVILSENDIGEPMFRQLLPYCKRVRIINHYYDMKKIGNDYGMTDIRIGGWSCGNDGSFTFVYGNKNGISTQIKIPDDLIQSEYTIGREEVCYVCEHEEIRYWRKAYDIQDWFHETIHEPVENTGYYILTEEMLIEFNKEFPDDRLPAEAPNDDYALVYWEWY